MLLWLFLLFQVFSQPPLQLVATIPVQSKIMSVDELGNVYLVRNGRTLIRFTPDGDSSAFYNGVNNGIMEAIDVTNPLRIMVYYPRYFKIVLLDRMLTPQNEIDLRKSRLIQIPAVATSADGNIWVYDQFNARLKKLNDLGDEVLVSNDLRQETATVPAPSSIVERDWKVYLCDSSQGIYLLDRYANYSQLIPIKGARDIQVVGDQLLYHIRDTLYSWDMKRIREQRLTLPHEEREAIIRAVVNRNILYVLYADKLVMYRVPVSPR